LEVLKNGNQWEIGGSRRKDKKMIILMKLFKWESKINNE